MSGPGEQHGIPTVVNASTASPPPPAPGSSPGGPPPRSPIAADDGRSGLPDPLRVPGLPKRYRIRRELGTGGYGKVYEAFDRLLGIDVAIKVINRTASHDARQSILGEAKKLARLSVFPGIARLHTAEFFRDPDTGDRRLYLVMDLVREATSLTRHADDRDLDTAQRIDRFIEVCDAVSFLHSLGIVHRDLKPANILVGKSPGTHAEAPHLIDFGIARETGISLDDRRGVEGTLAYMSPEQTRASADLTEASDVYSLGVILYLLLCGRLPYSLDKLTTEEAFRFIRSEPPDFDTAPASQLPASLQAIIRRAMSKRLVGETGNVGDGGPRYQNAGELADALRDYRDGKLVEPAPAFVRAANWSRRILARPYLGPAIVVVLAILLTDRIAVPLSFSRTGLAAAFQRAVIQPFEKFEDVTIVAANPSNPGVPMSSETGAFRGVLADAIDALVKHRPKAVVFDYFFRETPAKPLDASERESLERHTRALVKAAENALDTFPVVIGIEEWPNVNGRLARTLWEASESPQKILRVGSLQMQPAIESKPHASWNVPLLIDVDDGADVQTSLALETYAAVLRPAFLPKFKLMHHSQLVRINFSSKASERSPSPVPQPSLTINLPLSQVVSQPLEPRERRSSSAARSSKDEGLLVLTLPEQHVVDEAVITLDELLRDDPRAQRCQNKIVLFVNPDEEPLALAPDGTYRRKWLSHAVAIQMLLKSTPKYPTQLEELLITASGGLLGWFLVLPVTRRYAWWPKWWVAARLAIQVLAVAAVVAASFWLAWAYMYVVPPMIPLFAAAIGALLGLFVGESRRFPVKSPPKKAPA